MKGVCTLNAKARAAVKIITLLAAAGIGGGIAAKQPAAGEPPAPSASVAVKQIDLPLRTWVARPMKRPSYYASWHIGGKHGRVAFNSQNGRLYFVAGDWYSENDPLEDCNGNNETWSYSLADDTWRKEYPPGGTPCGPAGDDVPAQPDEAIWAYDSKRNLFYITPGFWFGAATYLKHCANGATPRHTAMVFNPTTKKWSLPAFGPPPDGYGGDTHAKSGVYDPVTDSLQRFRWAGSLQIEQLHLASNTWKVTPVGEYSLEQEQAAIDIKGRAVYAIEPFKKLLIQYNIDAKTVKVASALPETYTVEKDLYPPGSPKAAGAYSCNKSNLVFDPINGVLLMPNMASHHGEILKLLIYHVDTGVWETEAIKQPPGARVNGNTAGFDPVNNALLLIGGRITPHFFLYRYGDGKDLEKPPKEKPACGPGDH